MLPLSRALATALLLLTAAAAQADAGPIPPVAPITTDRPDFTESAVVVPGRMLQFESGITAAWRPSLRAISGPEALLRQGLGGRWELRLGFPDYNLERASGRDRTGFGASLAGIKVQLGPLRGTDAAIILQAALPTGASRFAGSAVDPEARLCLARQLSEKWSLSGMLHLQSATIDGRRHVGLLGTLSLSRGLTDRLSAFAEYVGPLTHLGDPERYFHAGLAYRLNADTQLDLHGGLGLSSAAADRFVGVGYSVRF